jgi:hypothetical protein
MNKNTNNNIISNENNEFDSTRTKFVHNIQKWVALDNSLKTMNQKVKMVREAKQNITDQICHYIHSENIQHKKIEISNGESLKVYNKNEYNPLTFSYIEECLTKLLPEKEDVDYIIQYLKENRKVTQSLDIRRNNLTTPIQNPNSMNT